MPISCYRIFCYCLMLLSINVHAAIEVYDFQTPAEERRFHALMDELRCPKCQNQNLAGSDAPIAKDLKQRTYELMQDGKSDQEIRQYMIDRYGDFISYKPPVRSTTFILWFGPFLLLVTVIAVLIWKKRRAVAPASHLSAEESARLALLLKRNHHD
ncbi:cytochrome c-type biogenesis protein [Agitococcus lubricus]|uniref:Cytochrome c-type biogenesis protein n=1 Tax=Agitococcus lubricus TaxID=1077255 RepID=A0A2T5IZB1_9GAMM|nr:cytochrome c-type biogenesis protein [Agitococcus lubricus]PTQ89359.1 cytochrome c-type biogenesis protein CcmH [Agitococcus lubricus]